MTHQCDQCRAPIVGDGYRTATRMLCDDCAVAFQGLALSVMSGGGVPEAVATTGWIARLREWRRRH